MLLVVQLFQQIFFSKFLNLDNDYYDCFNEFFCQEKRVFVFFFANFYLYNGKKIVHIMSFHN